MVAPCAVYPRFCRSVRFRLRHHARSPSRPRRSPTPVVPQERGDLIGLSCDRADPALRHPDPPGPRRTSLKLQFRAPGLRARRLSLSGADRPGAGPRDPCRRPAPLGRRHRVRRAASPRFRAPEARPSPTRPPRQSPGRDRRGAAATCASNAGSPLLPAAIRQLRIIRLRPMRLIGDPANSSRKLGIVEREQVGEPRRGKLGARQEGAVGGGGFGKAVPRADRQAIVAAIDAVAHRLAELGAGSAPDARSSGRKCSAAHRSGGRRRTPASGRRRGSACSFRNAGRRSAAASGSSSRLVRMIPRNSQLPCSRLTRLVCLPCQPIPAAALSGFSITGAVSTNTLSSDGASVDDEPRQRLQRLLDRLVIVAALGIDRDPAEFRIFGERQRVGRRRIAHPQRDRRFGFGPQRQRRDAVMRPLLHPAHRPVMPGLEPALELEPGVGRRIRARKAARRETEPGGFGFLLLPSGLRCHSRAATTPFALSLSKGCLSFFREISASTGSARTSYDGPAVEAVDLVKDFGDTRAVDGVSLAVPAGSIYGLLGPNGAGKTTTLRMLLGIIDPSSRQPPGARLRPPARSGACGRLSARGARPLPGDDPARGDRLHRRAARLAAGRGAAARRPTARRARPRRMGAEADPHSVQGHGADRPIARHHGPSAHG